MKFPKQAQPVVRNATKIEKLDRKTGVYPSDPFTVGVIVLGVVAIVAMNDDKGGGGGGGGGHARDRALFDSDLNYIL